MICGTLVLEDLTLHFEMVNPGEVVVRVADGLSGAQSEVRRTPRRFAASLALALDPDGFEGTKLGEMLYAHAESIEWPAASELRWIP